MQQHTPHKKARLQKQDWHPADIVAALWKRGITLRRLSRDNGYSRCLNTALREPWLQAEQIIAEAIGIPAEEIWPTRYTRDRSRALICGRRKVSQIDHSTGTPASVIQT